MGCLQTASPEADFSIYQQALRQLAGALRSHMSREQTAAFVPLAEKLNEAQKQALSLALANASQRYKEEQPSIASAILGSAKDFGVSIANLVKKGMS